MEEKPAFNGNLALLRVCAIILIAIGLSKAMGLSWALLVSGANDDSLSWAYVPAGLIVVALGAISLVKKNTLVLKIYAVFMFISMVLGAIDFVRQGLYLSIYYRTGYIVWKAIACFVNVNAVLIVASFLIERKTQNENMNLGLLRFCAAFFLVDGLNGIINILAAGDFKAFWGMSVLWTFVPIAVGLYALLKKNSLILMAYSVIAFAGLIWNTFQDTQEHFLTAFYAGNVAIGFLFSSFLVVCAATFFIEPERSKCYLQKVKRTFLFWKNLT